MKLFEFVNVITDYEKNHMSVLVKDDNDNVIFSESYNKLSIIELDILNDRYDVKNIGIVTSYSSNPNYYFGTFESHLVIDLI